MSDFNLAATLADRTLMALVTTVIGEIRAMVEDDVQRAVLTAKPCWEGIEALGAEDTVVRRYEDDTPIVRTLVRFWIDNTAARLYRECGNSCSVEMRYGQADIVRVLRDSEAHARAGLSPCAPCFDEFGGAPRHA